MTLVDSRVGIVRCMQYVLTGRDRPSSVLARLIDRFGGGKPAVSRR